MLLTTFWVHSVPGLVAIVVKGRGRPKEVVDALRVEDGQYMEGLGVLHVATFNGRLEVCIYLVEELQVDVNGVDKKSPALPKTPYWLKIFGHKFTVCSLSLV